MQKEMTNLCVAMAAKSVHTPAVDSSSPTARPSNTACRLSASTVKNSLSWVEAEESPLGLIPCPCRWPCDCVPLAAEKMGHGVF